MNSFPPHRLESLDNGNVSVRIPEAPTVIISKKSWIDVDEDMVVRPTVRFPGYRNEDLSGLQEELDEPLGEIYEGTRRSRTPIADDQYARPLVRFPGNDSRLFKPYSINSPVQRIPKAPEITLKENWMTVSENVTVRLPNYRQREEKKLQKENSSPKHRENSALISTKLPLDGRNMIHRVNELLNNARVSILRSRQSERTCREIPQRSTRN
jgi:hypothetical protein